MPEQIDQPRPRQEGMTRTTLEVFRDLVAATEDTLRTHPETACCGVTRARCAEAKHVLAEDQHAPAADCPNCDRTIANCDRTIAYQQRRQQQKGEAADCGSRLDV